MKERLLPIKMQLIESTRHRAAFLLLIKRLKKEKAMKRLMNAAMVVKIYSSIVFPVSKG